MINPRVEFRHEDSYKCIREINPFNRFNPLCL